jgi:23S rRNA (adenine2030-N6)-methyltransferase
MLSYRHAFHAGNHADVLKHCVLVQLLDYLTQKEKPLWFFDTHAGAGEYRLDERYAQTRAEYRTGIEKILASETLPAPVQAYAELVRALNPSGGFRLYPGSPRIALQMLRAQDRLRLFELHPTESKNLQQFCHAAGARAHATIGDGFSNLLPLLPPPSRRGLILIDPSYEDKQDYKRVIATVKAALARFASGCYLVWYPHVAWSESRRLADSVIRLCKGNWLHASLTVSEPLAVGLYGSGVVVINPPHTLGDTLQAVLPWLASTLGQDDHAQYLLDYEIN